MMRIWPVLGLTVALLAPQASAENPAEPVIRDTVQKYVAAFNSADAEAAAALYTPDGIHTNVLGITRHGRKEIAQDLGEQFAGPFRGARISITTLRIQFLSPSVAVEEESFTLEGPASPESKPVPLVRGVCLAVHQQLEGRWLAAAVQCLAPPPPPPGH